MVPYVVEAVHIRTEGVQKCRLHQSGPHEAVKCHGSMKNRTPGVQGSTGPPKLCT